MTGRTSRSSVQFERKAFLACGIFGRRVHLGVVLAEMQPLYSSMPAEIIGDQTAYIESRVCSVDSSPSQDQR